MGRHFVPLCIPCIPWLIWDNFKTGRISLFPILQVSYVKSSDKYLIGCFVLVFLTLIEYCTVLLLKAKQKQRNVRIRGMIEAQVTFAIHLASISGNLTFFSFPGVRGHSSALHSDSFLFTLKN